MKNSVQFESQGSKLTFTRIDDEKNPSFKIETTRAYSMKMPLGRYIRTLVELYGYAEVQRLVDNYPDNLK